MKTNTTIHRSESLFSARHFLSATAGHCALLLILGTGPALAGDRSEGGNAKNNVPDGLNASEWASIRAAYEAGRHAVQPQPNGTLAARNPGQAWRTHFDGRGFLVEPLRTSAERGVHAASMSDSQGSVKRSEDRAPGDDAAWQWGLELKHYGFPGQERAVGGPAPMNTAGQRVAYAWDDTLQEWFVNDARGLEHGFTVKQRPHFREVLDCGLSACPAQAGSPLPLSQADDFSTLPALTSDPQRTEQKRQRTGAVQDADAPGSAQIVNRQSEIVNPLTFQFAVRGTLRPVVEADGSGVRFVDAQGAAVVNYTGLKVWDADGRMLSARFEAVAEPSQPASDSRQLLERPNFREVLDCGSPLPLSQAEKLSQPQPVTSDASRAEQRRQRTGALQDADAPDSAAIVNRKSQIINLLVDERDARYPITVDPIAQQAYLKASNTETSDRFGYSVAVSSNTVVVGAIFESSSATGVNGNQLNNSASNSGAAYIFVRSGGVWSQQAYLKASNTGADDRFGWSVAVSGDTVVVGAIFESSNATGVNGNQSDNSLSAPGAAYVFVRVGGVWSQQAYLKASNTGTDDLFGWSVAVSGDTVVVGARDEASNATGVNGNQLNNSANQSGAAYVFVRSGGLWNQQAYLKASNTEVLDNFGFSVAVSGDTVVVGGRLEGSNATGINGNQADNSAQQSGAAYVFVRSGGLWSQQAYLKASNTGEGDTFGWSVSVSGDTVVVGSAREDSNATGVNGDGSNNSATDSGAAYVFVRSGGVWSQQAYLKASNTGAGDEFGISVAVSLDTVVVGAYHEDSSTTGVNGNQADDSTTNSGAAYVFVRSGGVWIQQSYRKASNTGAGDEFGISVAVSGDTVVVGADAEDSNATGINGNQADNSVADPGAAYVFTGFSTDLCASPELTILPAGYFIRFYGTTGCTYQVQRAPTVNGPWTTIATLAPLVSDPIEYHDATPPPGQSFYRTVQP